MHIARRLAWVVLVLGASALGCRSGAPTACDPCAVSGVGGFGFTSWGRTVFGDSDGDTFFADGAGVTTGGLGGFADPAAPAAAPAATTASWIAGAGKSCGGPAGDTTGINIQNFQGHEINLGPSNYVQLEHASSVRNSVELRSRERWKAVMEDLEVSTLPQVEIAQAEIIVRKGTRKAPRTWKRSTVVPNAARLTVGDDDALPLEAMDISVRIDGFRARVVLDCFFRNDRDTQLAGTFQLRLPNGARPHYLAFGRTQLERPAFTPSVPAGLASIRESRTPTWEAPKEARMVPREQAAFAYTDTVRQKIDPALLEWTGTGVFDARVFPLEAGALHHIAIAYDTTLARLGTRLLHRLHLPRGVPDLDVEISATGGRLRVAPRTAEKEGRFRWRNPRVPEILTAIERPGPVLLTGTKPGLGPHFAARFTPQLPDAPAASKPKALFLVDTSLSSNPDRFNTWLGLLKQILEKNRPALREFAVAFFNVETFAWRPGFQPNTPANADAVMRYARTLALEGATDLGQALAASRARAAGADVFLLSDAAVTWGEADLHALRAHLPQGSALFAYATGGSGTNMGVLQHLARETGGAVFTVASEAHVAKAAVAHRKRPWRLEGVSIAGTSDVLLDGRPATLFPGQMLTVAGRGTPDAGAEIELRLRQGATERVVRHELGTALPSVFTGRIYGEIAVSQLEAFGEITADASRAYASEFRVVGRSCSLLMLETEEDYERYEIKPLDDRALIEERLASTVVQDTLREHSEAIGDPKRRLLARLERLAKIEALGLSLPDATRAVFEALPEDAYRVPVAPLRAQVRRATGVPAGMRRALARRGFTYDSMTAEADRRRKQHGPADGLRALSSLVEESPADLVLLRDVASTAMAWGLHGQAYSLLSRVAERRPYELPVYVSLGRCLTEMGRTDLALLHYELALNGAHASADFKRIVSFEYARVLRGATSDFGKMRLAEIRKVAENGADLVVVLEWNTDRSDVDLHVWDPAGEECFYSNKKTKAGGTITEDVTGGFGPEMFVIEKAPPGRYTVDVVYYAGDSLRTKSRSKAMVTIYENWGRPHESMRRRAITLVKKGERQAVMTITR